VFFTAMLVVKVYKTLTPRRIGQIGFAICTLSLLWLALVVRNDWSAVPVMFGLIAFGIGQGALVTLVFNVLVTAAPKELAGDVGSLRGTANNLAAGVGTAVAGALLVGLLSSMIFYRIADNQNFPVEVQNQLNLDNITFVTNDRLLTILQGTTATPAQVEEAVRINTESRLRALKIALLVMACVALLAIAPACRLPNYKPGEIPDNPPPSEPEALRRAAQASEA
jgi:MFS family permease